MTWKYIFVPVSCKDAKRLLNDNVCEVRVLVNGKHGADTSIIDPLVYDHLPENRMYVASSCRINMNTKG